MRILRKFPPPFVFCKLCVHMLVNKKKFERNSSLEYWNDLSWETKHTSCGNFNFFSGHAGSSQTKVHLMIGFIFDFFDFLNSLPLSDTHHVSFISFADGCQQCWLECNGERTWHFAKSETRPQSSKVAILDAANFYLSEYFISKWIY